MAWRCGKGRGERAFGSESRYVNLNETMVKSRDARKFRLLPTSGAFPKASQPKATMIK